jgi:hypothetical protein
VVTSMTTFGGFIFDSVEVSSPDCPCEWTDSVPSVFYLFMTVLKCPRLTAPVNDRIQSRVCSICFLFLTVLKCPRLTAPVNGLIQSRVCSNYYGATCQVGCTSAFNLQGGTGTVTCQKVGNVAQWTPAVSTLQCKGSMNMFIVIQLKACVTICSTVKLL